MKKLVLLLTMMVSLTTTHELYAKGNSGKISRKEKNLRGINPKERSLKKINMKRI